MFIARTICMYHFGLMQHECNDWAQCNWKRVEAVFLLQLNWLLKRTESYRIALQQQHQHQQYIVQANHRSVLSIHFMKSFDHTIRIWKNWTYENRRKIVIDFESHWFVQMVGGFWVSFQAHIECEFLTLKFWRGEEKSCAENGDVPIYRHLIK